MTKLLGQILLSKKAISEAELNRAVEMAKIEGVLLGQYLIKNLSVAENTVYEALAEQFFMPYETLVTEKVNTTLLHELPTDFFKQYRCLPLQTSDEIVKIAVDDPLDLNAVAAVELALGTIVSVVLTSLTDMEQVRRNLFGSDSFFKQSVGKISREYEKQLQITDEEMSVAEIRKRTESEPVVKMVSLIFDEALRQRASDIHIEPSEHHAVVRYRIDGMLKKHMELSRWMYLPLTSRIKIMADLDIAEKRIPQDGRIRYDFENKDYDFRVSTLPTHYGEKTVVRILKHDPTLLDLNKLGIPQPELEIIKEHIVKPQGMIFVTGPTGSGKSSTLFACLNSIRKKEINITTIENPIEYKLEGINQVQVNEKAGVTFATTLRSILRQDPDVILIGEIRDKETAEIAIQASQTGHLVFSTLHTNDAISAITRLRDLGIPSFLIASSVLSIIAQRLVRTLCPLCKVKKELSGETKSRWHALLGSEKLPESYSPAGCEQCNGIGYKGRIGVFEVIPVDEKIREMIIEDVSELKIRHYLRSIGIKNLIQNGIEKIEQGITTPEELLRVVLIEDVMQIKNHSNN